MGRMSGFVIIVANSNSGGRIKKGKFWFGCERDGHPRSKKLKNDEEFKSNKKYKCPFQL